MFTGIVEEKGKVLDVKSRKNLCVLRVKTAKVSKGLKPGESVAVGGVCLTATSARQGVLSFDIMQETIAATTLKNLRSDTFVNLERALTGKSRFGGHFVTGHVDGVGTVTARLKKPNYVELRIKPPQSLRKYLVAKGSVCIDGVSLTIGKVSKEYFSVFLIPFTLKVTTLGNLSSGNKVNIETDIVAKYVLGRR